MQLCNFITFAFSCSSVLRFQKSDKRPMQMLETIRQTMFLLKNNDFLTWIGIPTSILALGSTRKSKEDHLGQGIKEWNK